jgi:hypothetical protein
LLHQVLQQWHLLGGELVELIQVDEAIVGQFAFAAGGAGEVETLGVITLERRR